MRRRLLLLSIIVGVAVLGVAIWQFAPQLTALQEPAEITPEISAIPCLMDAFGDCHRMPAVVGVDIDNQEIRFPERFTAAYYLVVMPYDREQQQGALTWLQPFQEIAAEYDVLHYYSIAALPDLSAPIRLLVVGGLAAGVRDEAVRSQVAILFLEDQAAFLEALGVDNAEAMSAFLMDQNGAIYWRTTGEYSENAAEEIQELLATLLS